MKKLFDIHISADNISQKGIKELFSEGYTEDKFINNFNSQPVFFHATNKHINEENRDEIWKTSAKIIEDDKLFNGTLEEEYYFEEKKALFSGKAYEKIPSNLTPFKLIKCPPNKHKSCDIHINIDLKKSSKTAIQSLDNLNFISFERKIGTDTHRIYSLTFHNLKLGEQVFSVLSNTITNFPTIFGKMKIEYVSRFLTSPETATQLPIVPDKFVINWLKKHKTTDLEKMM